MPELDDYVDVRWLHPRYTEDICAHCGELRWFTADEAGSKWRCRDCGRERLEDIAFCCPSCGTRMLPDGDEWECRYCGEREPLNRETLIDRMTGEFEPSGYDRGTFTECPLCGTIHTVRCGPDGERVCTECDEFYVGRFSAGWFAYAVWLDDRTAVRTRVVAE